MARGNISAHCTKRTASAATCATTAAAATICRRTMSATTVSNAAQGNESGFVAWQPAVAVAPHLAATTAVRLLVVAVMRPLLLQLLGRCSRWSVVLLGLLACFGDGVEFVAAALVGCLAEVRVLGAVPLEVVLLQHKNIIK